MDDQKIKVYIKVNDQNEIIDINSDIFINDFSGWIEVDEGFGDKYAHAQGLYLDEPLIDDNGGYNYVFERNEITKK
jgi:hypothetical protein